MTSPLEDPSEPDPPTPPGMKSLKLRGNVVLWCLSGAILSGTSLILLTGLTATPWLFLLYPVLLGILLVSLGVLALHLVHRL